MIDKTYCEWPGCREAGNESHMLTITNKPDSDIVLPFCRYHYYIVIGGHFTLVKRPDGAKSEFRIQGPLEMLEIAEQVMMARELTLQEKKK